MHQVGANKHFHLEQPQVSELMDQPEIMDTKLGTLKAMFDMCQVGKLKLPESESYLQKQTQVSTTSRRLFENLHTQMCPKNHDHDHIKGKTKIHGKWVNVSSFAKGYTVGFARKIASCICNWGYPESPLIVEEMILGLEEHENPKWHQRHCSCKNADVSPTSNQRHLCMARHPLGKRYSEQWDIRPQGLASTILGKVYGRVDGTYLWYCELKRVLISLGFVVCPFDGCLLVLVTEGSQGQPIVHGVLGVHVDDGTGGGDSHFKEVLQNLRKRFSFGAYNEHEFDFCGVHYIDSGMTDGTIELDQREYIKKIEPLNVPKNRRAEPDAELTDSERQCLRGLCGSLQFAAVHSRPDLCAKVGQLQASIPIGKVSDLLEGNRVLYEGKQHPVCVCAYSSYSAE